MRTTNQTFIGFSVVQRYYYHHGQCILWPSIPSLSLGVRIAWLCFWLACSLLAIYFFAAAIFASSHSIPSIYFVPFSVMGSFFLSVYELSNNVRLAWRCDTGVSDLFRSHQGHDNKGHMQYILQYLFETDNSNNFQQVIFKRDPRSTITFVLPVVPVSNPGPP